MDLTGQTFYHGSPAVEVTPTFGLGDDHHDYGRGFYLTDDPLLAREWAVCRPEARSGWVHGFRLTEPDLSVLDFQERGVLAWMAELMKHREAGKSKRFGMQYCLKSERAFAAVERAEGFPQPVDYETFSRRYNERDRQARDRMDELIAGPKNAAVKVMSTLV